MGLLKDIVMPALGVNMPGRGKKKDSGGPVESNDAINYRRGVNAGNYKRGGKVRKTGLAKVHKGERVLTTAQAKRYKHKRSAKR